MDDFENLTEEQIQQLMELGILPDQQNLLSDQLAQAQALRYGEGPQGRQAGRVFTAANPLEHVAHAMQGRQAQQDIDRIQQQQQDILGRQTAGRQAFFDALRRRRAPQTVGKVPNYNGPI